MFDEVLKLTSKLMFLDHPAYVHGAVQAMECAKKVSLQLLVISLLDVDRFSECFYYYIL